MEQILPHKGWAAVYCRLSREDEDKTARESESIRNQRELLLNWAQAHGYRVYRVYIDEDYSGIDWGRPGFNAMLADAQAGKFEVILAKTQSRFTRDMELVERYLHGLFPEWGVRFVPCQTVAGHCLLPALPAALASNGRKQDGIYAAFCDMPPPPGGWTALVSAETAALLGK